jgi:hypothetical protein
LTNKEQRPPISEKKKLRGLNLTTEMIDPQIAQISADFFDDRQTTNPQVNLCTWGCRESVDEKRKRREDFHLLGANSLN